MPEVDLVAVEGEDLALGVALLDLDGEQRFLHLAFEALLEPDGEEVAGQLLRQGAGAGRVSEPPLKHVAHHRDEDARDAQAEVRIEVGVFGRDDRLTQLRRDVVVADHQPTLDGKFADHLAVRRVDARDGARIVVVERRDFGQVAGKGEEHAAQGAEERGRRKEGDERGAAGDADDVIGHDSDSVQASGFRLRASRLDGLQDSSA